MRKILERYKSFMLFIQFEKNEKKAQKLVPFIHFFVKNIWSVVARDVTESNNLNQVRVK